MTKRILKIDNIDIKILQNLQQDGRMSNIKLSEIVGISASPCLRRLTTLIKNDIIKGFYAELDEKFFGYNLTIFASISIEVNSESEREIFEKELTMIPEIREIYSLSLETDYLLKFLIQDFLDYKRIINSKVSRIPYIKKIRTTQITRVIKKEPGFEIKED